MNDCTRIAPLLDVYLDDETTPETNVFVQRHLEDCPSCAARLQAAQHLRASMQSALRAHHAPASLHHRVRAALAPEPRPALASFIRNWVVPAAATAIVAWIVLPWRPQEPEVYAAMAVGEHVACALKHATPHRDPSSFAANVSFPLIPASGAGVRVLDAHACGQASEFLHVVLEESGTKASILIARAGEGAARVFGPERRGDYEVSVIRTTRHRAYVVIDRSRAQALGAWREPAVQRVQGYLKQLEGP